MRNIANMRVNLPVAVAILGGVSATAGHMSALAAGPENSPAISIGLVDAGLRVDDVEINVPLTPIEDGQTCVAFAMVNVGTPPYYFEWSGQFDNSDAYGGLLGSNQIVSDYVDENGPSWLRVDVWTNSTKTLYIGFAEVELDIDDEHEYNPGCEE